jgi:uncharacterized SAM-binding protein YcdF (DUF218 family)
MRTSVATTFGGATAAAGVVALWRLIASPRVEAPAAGDAVVVLEGDRPRRVRAAVALAAGGYAPVLVVVRAENAAPELLRHSAELPFQLVSLTPDPPTTRGEARAVARLAAERRWQRILVVTSTFHVTRARLIFGRALDLDVAFASAGMNRRRLPKHVASEAAKLLLALTLRRGA